VVNIQNGAAHFDIAVPEAAFNKADNLSFYIPTGVKLEHPSVTSLLKRGLDILGGLVGLMITAIILVPVAIAIQIDNPGPIFYSQVRCGHRGKTFRIWKFRSMVADADKLKHLVKNEAQGLVFKNKNDPRITRVGRLLRKTSLDEFPQFLNVLMGDMSLVGTRPPTVDEVMQYEKHHWQRLNVKPGITGEWQVRGRSSVSDFEDIVSMDLSYQEQWSFFYDLKLLVETVLVVLYRKGAY
jgi:lipopolysaccharide/colanic/teichoic acid biosynthesis glycosyltransferase